MREGHRAQDVEEQRQLVAQVEPVGAAVFVGWFAVDVFERQVRAAAFVDARVVEPRDVRMLERSEDVGLACDALLDAAVDEPRCV
jgi:hypothetical protein